MEKPHATSSSMPHGSHTRLKELFISEAFKMLCRYIRNRERTSRVTDVSQLIAVMRNDLHQSVERDQVIEVLKALEEIKIGKLENVSGRKKFVWHQWILVSMDTLTDTIRDISLQPLEKFQSDPNAYRRTMDAIREVEVRSAAKNASGSAVSTDLAGLVFNASISTPPKTRIASSEVDLQTLVEEIESRGWEVSLKLKKSKAN